MPKEYAEKGFDDPYDLMLTEEYPYPRAFAQYVFIRLKAQHELNCIDFFLRDQPVQFRPVLKRILGLKRGTDGRERVDCTSLKIYKPVTISLRESTGFGPFELGKEYKDDVAKHMQIKEKIKAKQPDIRTAPTPKELKDGEVNIGDEIFMLEDNGHLFSFPRRLASWGRFLSGKSPTFWDVPEKKAESTPLVKRAAPPSHASPSSSMDPLEPRLPDYDDSDDDAPLQRPAKQAKRAVPAPAPAPAPVPPPAPPQAPAPAPAPVPAPAPAPVVPLDLEEELKDVEARIDSVTLIDENERVGAYQVVLEELKREGSLTKDAPVVYLRQIPEICKLFKGWTSNNAIWKCIDTLFLGMTPAEYKSPKWQGLEKYYWKNDRGAGFVPITNQRKRVCDLDHPFAQHANPFCHPRFMIVCNRAMNDLWADKGVACRIGLGTNRQQMRAIGSEMKHMMAFMKKEKMFERIFADLEQHMPLLPPPALR